MFLHIKELGFFLYVRAQSFAYQVIYRFYLPKDNSFIIKYFFLIFQNNL